MYSLYKQNLLYQCSLKREPTVIFLIFWFQVRDFLLDLSILQMCPKHPVSPLLPTSIQHQWQSTGPPLALMEEAPSSLTSLRPRSNSPPTGGELTLRRSQRRPSRFRHWRRVTLMSSEWVLRTRPERANQARHPRRTLQRHSMVSDKCLGLMTVLNTPRHFSTPRGCAIPGCINTVRSRFKTSPL